MNETLGQTRTGNLNLNVLVNNVRATTIVTPANHMMIQGTRRSQEEIAQGHSKGIPASNMSIGRGRR